MDLIKNLGRSKIALIIGGTLLTLFLIGVVAFNVGGPTMVPLYSELSQDDASLVVSKLQVMGKKFSTDKDGKTIMVPINDVLPLRMQLAQEGIPTKSTMAGYELFDKADMVGTSQFVNNVNALRALEGELVRTIDSLSEVDKSRVHLVLQKNDTFSRTGPAASASIFLKLKSGQSLTKQQINGITHLVATAVPGLKTDKITIIDQNGKPLKISGEEDDESISTISEYKNNLENRLKRAVEELVGKYAGHGKVQANVVADIDFDKVVINKEDFDPNVQVIRSEKKSTEKDNDTQMDKNVSVATNIPNFLQKQEPSNKKEHERNDEIINYEISRTITNKVVQWGAVKQLSVAVLVDGIYEKDKNTKLYVYKRDRTPEELAKIKQLVAAAIGIDESRGDKLEVMNLQFANENLIDDSEESVVKYTPTTIFQIVLIIAILLAAVLFLLKPLLQQKFGKKTNNTTQETDGMTKSLTEKLNEAGSSSTTAQANENSSHKPFAEKQYEQLLRYVNDSASQDMENIVKIIRRWIAN